MLDPEPMVGMPQREVEEAAERNRRQPINDANFERFFGFTGTAQRNT